MDLKIGSINIRGLGDRSKRREIFNWLKRKQMSIYFIQKAHCTDDNMHNRSFYSCVFSDLALDCKRGWG